MQRKIVRRPHTSKLKTSFHTGLLSFFGVVLKVTLFNFILKYNVGPFAIPSVRHVFKILRLTIIIMCRVGVDLHSSREIRRHPLNLGRCIWIFFGCIDKDLDIRGKVWLLLQFSRLVLSFNGTTLWVILTRIKIYVTVKETILQMRFWEVPPRDLLLQIDEDACLLSVPSVCHLCRGRGSAFPDSVNNNIQDVVITPTWNVTRTQLNIFTFGLPKYVIIITS